MCWLKSLVCIYSPFLLILKNSLILHNWDIFAFVIFGSDYSCEIFWANGANIKWGQNFPVYNIHVQREMSTKPTFSNND